MCIRDRLFPGLQRFFGIDLHIAVSEAAFGHFTDYGIGYAKLAHLIRRNFSYDIAEACGKQDVYKRQVNSRS